MNVVGTKVAIGTDIVSNTLLEFGALIWGVVWVPHNYRPRVHSWITQ